MMRVANFAARWTLLFRRMKSSKTLVFLVRSLQFAKSWGLVKRFTFSGFVVMVLGMAGIGWWVGEQIKIGVIQESAAATALYMDSFIAPHVQELSSAGSISAEHIEDLDELFNESDLGARTVSVKVWNDSGQIAYSNIPSLIGRSFPITEDLEESWHGEVTGEVSKLEEEENIAERDASYSKLLEIYSPVRLNDSDQIIAVAEFYQKLDTLEEEIVVAQRKAWLVISSTMTAMYLLLVGFVQLANKRISQQELELKSQVSQLLRHLSHNKELSMRVRVAAANTTSLNESFLRRTSAEIHDGPVQEISLALLRLDNAIDQNESASQVQDINLCGENLMVVQKSLQSALENMRTIASRFGLPQLDGMSLSDVIYRVVRTHEQRTATKVKLILSNLPDNVNLPIKITVYRFIQEALNNASLHASGKGQEVRVMGNFNQVKIEVSDQGPGFDIHIPIEMEGQLGLPVMRERVESLGGQFFIESAAGKGTKLTARLSLQNIGENIHG